MKRNKTDMCVKNERVVVSKTLGKRNNPLGIKKKLPAYETERYMHENFMNSYRDKYAEFMHEWEYTKYIDFCKQVFMHEWEYAKYNDLCKQEFIKYRAPIAMIYDISCNEQNANRVFADEYIVSKITAFL